MPRSQHFCRRFHVRRLDVFGSTARGDFDPAQSDFDFLVEFDRSAPEALSLKTFFGLKAALEKPFGRSIDLVEPSAMRNPYVKASVDRVRELVSLKRDPKTDQKASHSIASVALQEPTWHAGRRCGAQRLPVREKA